MWVNRMPAAYAPSWPRVRSLPLAVRGAPTALLGNLGHCDNTMGAVSGQTRGALGGAATGAKVGSIAGPIGTGVGAVVGAIAGAIFGGHADHAKINADVAGRKQLFSDYLSVAGTIPGRAIGLARLRDIWKGAAHMGHFPGWQGQEQRIDYAIDGCSKCDQNTMNVLLKQARGTPAAPVVRMTAPTTFGIPAAPSRMTATIARGGILQGLGDLGAIDAKTFVDQYFIPANQAQGDHWAANTDATGRQVIYDVADAYLASLDQSTPVYITSAASTPTASGPVQQVAVPVNTLPTQSTTNLSPAVPVVPLQAPTSPTTTTVVSVPATATGAPDIAALVRQLMAQGQAPQQAYNSALSSLQAAGVQPTGDVQQATATAVREAGLGSGVPSWLLAVLLAGGAVFALARPVNTPTRARERRE